MALRQDDEVAVQGYETLPTVHDSSIAFSGVSLTGESYSEKAHLFLKVNNLGGFLSRGKRLQNSSSCASIKERRPNVCSAV